MRRKKRRMIVKAGICAVYVGVVVFLVFGLLRGEGDVFGGWLRQMAAGAENGPVQEAFGTLTDGLGGDRPVKDVLAESYGVLIGETD